MRRGLLAGCWRPCKTEGCAGGAFRFPSVDADDDFHGQANGVAGRIRRDGAKFAGGARHDGERHGVENVVARHVFALRGVECVVVEIAGVRVMALQHFESALLAGFLLFGNLERLTVVHRGEGELGMRFAEASHVVAMAAKHAVELFDFRRDIEALPADLFADDGLAERAGVFVKTGVEGASWGWAEHAGAHAFAEEFTGDGVAFAGWLQGVGEADGHIDQHDVARRVHDEGPVDGVEQAD